MRKNENDENSPKFVNDRRQEIAKKSYKKSGKKLFADEIEFAENNVQVENL